jgi:hypothetical protein
MQDIEGNPIPGLGSYNPRVDVHPETTLSDSGGLGANRARRVTVTVTVAGALQHTIVLEGWRVRYSP